MKKFGISNEVLFYFFKRENKDFWFKGFGLDF